MDQRVGEKDMAEVKDGQMCSRSAGQRAEVDVVD